MMECRGKWRRSFAPLAVPLPNPDHARWFAEEVLPHGPRLRAWLQARFPKLSDSEDIVQESFSRLVQSHATGPVACPRAFLFVTARNLALNRLRHLRIERPEGATEIDALAVVDDAVGIPEALAHAEDFRVLVRAIEALPERCRQVLTLRKIYGLSQKEVAERLNISEATVETQGSIGLRKCIEFFRRHGYAPKTPS
jgi:RNA polymerase sigma factor (sigma-70 family)